MKDNVRVLHFTSHNEDCGIAKYQENYLRGMEGIPQVMNKVFEVSPYQTRKMNAEELNRVLNQLREELKDFDILHIQHEFSFFHFDEFKKLVELGKQAGKKVIVSIHLSPAFAIKSPHRGGLGPRSLVLYLRQRRHYNHMFNNHVVPMRKADLLLVHNQVTLESLKTFGINPDNIKKLTHPVYDVAAPPPSTEIATQLKKSKDDIIYCITGFLHRYKGVTSAVRALKFLPTNYKLALIGGVKADSDEVTYQDKVTNLIDQLGLHDRVYITGFIEDDNRMNALIRECDISVYPYDRIYYSNLSSGSLNLALANGLPVIAYPTESFKEVVNESNGAIVLCITFAYYELARELQRIDKNKQINLSKEYANKMAWPKMAKLLVDIYRQVANVAE